jgi:hypothetical protein
MDCVASLALTWLPLNTAPRSRGAMRPRFSKIIRPRVQRAQGMPGARCTRGLVCKTVQKAHTSIQVQTGHPDIPCAMVLRLMPRAPRRRIRLATVADGLKDCLNPVGSTRLRQLDTSNGCQDHTVLPYAASRLRLRASPGTARLRTQVYPGIGAGRPRAVFAHGPKPALRPRHAPDAAASTATRPNVRDDGQRPSTGTGWLEM